MTFFLDLFVKNKVKIIFVIILMTCLLYGVWFYKGVLIRMTRWPFLPEMEAAPRGTIRFAVIGDYGSGNLYERDIANLIESWNVDFITTVGDNNHPVGAAETIDQNIGRFYHKYISPYKGKYGSGAKTNRFFPIPGHRDWDTDNLQPFINYFSLPGNKRYYDFVWGPVHFFMLDTDERDPDGATENSKQFSWLKQVLSSSTQPWNLVYAHHAPYSSGWTAGFKRMRWPFKEWGANGVFSGYYHVYERLLVDGIPYFISGVGGSFISGFGETDAHSQYRYDKDFGAILVEANDTQITFQFINRKGKVIDKYYIQKKGGTFYSPYVK